MVLLVAFCMLGCNKEKNSSETLPDKPANLIATPVSSSMIDLNWDTVADVLGYRVERSINKEVGFLEIASETTHAIFRDEGLSAGTTYYYRVRAFNEAGNSEFSNTAQVTTRICSYKYDESTYFASCEEIIDTCGLILYPFVPFTDEEWREKSYAYKLEQRQIPKDFLHKMTTEALFYQIVFCEINNTLLFRKPDIRLNMVAEFLSRSDGGHILLNLLKRYNPLLWHPQIHETDPRSVCTTWLICLQIFGSQPEVINGMTDDEIHSYLHHQLRFHDFIRNMCIAGNDQSCYTGNMALILPGLCNVMIRYRFEPLIQYFDSNPHLQQAVGTFQINEQLVLDIINYTEQFLNSMK